MTRRIGSARGRHRAPAHPATKIAALLAAIAAAATLLATAMLTPALYLLALIP